MNVTVGLHYLRLKTQKGTFTVYRYANTSTFNGSPTYLFPWKSESKLMIRVHDETIHKHKSCILPNLETDARWLCSSRSYMAAKYSLLSFGSGFMDLSPGFHPAGQTSSGFSCTYCNACLTHKIIRSAFSPFSQDKIPYRERWEKWGLPLPGLWGRGGRWENYLQSPHCFINAPTNRKVVDGGVLNDPLLVDDEKSPQCNPLQTKTFANCQYYSIRRP